MAAIKPIESSSVHRIQSGQVIVDLCSVVKELVENSIDAGATSVDVRFKNSGLDAIEVIDNGSGIAKDDFESVALKHYTSKLKSYDDLSLLDTFGFRGEALSSLCALADVNIITAQEHDAPKGTRLDFESSGALKNTSIVATQRGTTVSVETIFKNLPVRRQELTKSLQREYKKVLGLLHAYACISTKARISVSNIAAKGKKTIVFATKAGQTTRENIANVYGTKTTAVLVPLDLQFELHQTGTAATQCSKAVRILGHVSKPTVGEGRQTPDRQMFFVNGRPCVLPQIAKTMNEVYKSYNLSQSPFVFADVQLDTAAYDVNVSPDKRTILLHEQNALLESLRTSLAELFDKQTQTVPQAKGMPGITKLPGYNPLTVPRYSQDHGRKEIEDRANKGNDRPEPVPGRNDRASRSSGIGDATAGRFNEQDGLVQRLFTHKVQDREHPAYKQPVVPDGVTALKVTEPSNEATTEMPTEHAAAMDVIVASVGGNVEAAGESPVDDEEPLFVQDQLPTSDLAFSDHSNNTGLGETQAMSTANLLSSQPNRPSAPTPGGHPVDTGLGLTAGRGRKPVLQNQGNEVPAEELIPSTHTSPVKATPGPVPNAFDRMRPLRTPTQQATITIGDQTTTTTIGGSSQKLWTLQTDKAKSKTRTRILPKQASKPTFQSSLRAFAAPGSQMRREAEDGAEESEEEDAPTETPVPSRRTQRPQVPLVSTVFHSSGSRAEEDRREGEHDLEETDDGAEADLSQPGQHSDEDSDGEYLDEETQKLKEDERVARLIQDAEERAARPNVEGIKRAGRLLKGGNRAATTRLLLTVPDTQQEILKHVKQMAFDGSVAAKKLTVSRNSQIDDVCSAEDRLSLTVSKGDFARMRIAGQFNLGFIIALRPAAADNDREDASHGNDEVFIIDQHASDEKYNFERLQATTVVQNQPLVHKHRLDLTAIEEEVIIENQDTLLKNGFEVEIDESGDQPVGKRCTLVRLPMSKEVTFSTRDLEELIALLAENPPAQTQTSAPTQQRNQSLTTAPSGSFSTITTATSSFLAPIMRPSAVRKMFAMRACRSSVMIGKTLNVKQMKGLVTNMGQMEKPWNCPHGRPTMRHLISLGEWQGWAEGEGPSGMVEDEDFEELKGRTEVDWAAWLGVGSSDDDDGEGAEAGDDEESEGEEEEREGSPFDGEMAESQETGAEEDDDHDEKDESDSDDHGDGLNQTLQGFRSQQT